MCVWRVKDDLLSRKSLHDKVDARNFYVYYPLVCYSWLGAKSLVAYKLFGLILSQIFLTIFSKFYIRCNLHFCNIH